MQHRRLAPSEAVAKMEIDRPVAVQFRSRSDFNIRSRLGVAVNTRGKSVGALPFDDAIDRRGAIDMIAAARKRNRA